MAFNASCDNTQMVPFTAAPTYQDPNTGELVAAKVDGALRITVLSGDGSFSQDPASPLTFNGISGADGGVEGVPANTVYEVRVDGDLGPGVNDVVETVTLSVSPAPPPPIPQASALGFVAGAPVPKISAARR